MRRPSRVLATAAALCLVGRPDYTQFGNRVHAGRADVQAERTISSWAVVDWKDEMSREELLAAWIRQLERRLEDVERAVEKVRAARVKNKGRFD